MDPAAGIPSVGDAVRQCLTGLSWLVWHLRQAVVGRWRSARAWLLFRLLRLVHAGRPVYPVPVERVVSGLPLQHLREVAHQHGGVRQDWERLQDLELGDDGVESEADERVRGDRGLQGRDPGLRYDASFAAAFHDRTREDQDAIELLVNDLAHADRIQLLACMSIVRTLEWDAERIGIYRRNVRWGRPTDYDLDTITAWLACCWCYGNAEVYRQTPPVHIDPMRVVEAALYPEHHYHDESVLRLRVGNIITEWRWTSDLVRGAGNVWPYEPLSLREDSLAWHRRAIHIPDDDDESASSVASGRGRNPSSTGATSESNADPTWAPDVARPGVWHHRDGTFSSDAESVDGSADSLRELPEVRDD